MKSLLKTIAIFFVPLVVMLSCKKDYFVNTGVQQGVYNGSTLSFIESRKDLFDSLRKVIKIANMEQVFANNQVTFFAPTDYSIKKTIKNLNVYLFNNGKDTVSRLEQIHPDVWKNYLSMYVFNEVLFLKDIPQIDTLNMDKYKGQGFTSINNQNMNLGVLYNDVSASGQGGGQVIKYVGYRQLYISSIRNISDLTSFGAMINAPVSTSNIKTNNGVVHVLNLDKHSFGFDVSKFITSVYSKGLVSK